MKSKQEIKVGIYARLSRDDERNGESLSIENQKLILEKYVLEQGWNLVETYVDEFIERVKKYINSPVLTREMSLELNKFITIDKFTNGSKEPRKIHIYYKLIDNINGIDFKRNKQKRDRL